jgi:hypothetical protein
VFSFTTTQSITVMAAAVLVTGPTAFFASVVPEARADIQFESSLQLSAKGDRLRPLVMEAECASPGWPHYQPSCLFDLRGQAHEAPTVRIIAFR